MPGKPYPEPPEPDVFTVAERIDTALKLGDAQMAAALDEYGAKHDADNLRVRFLSRRRGYEVTVYLDAATLSQ